MIAIETIHWHTLAPGFLSPSSRVLDIGANYGLFSRSIVQRIGCHCVAVEPSPEIYRDMPSSPLIKKVHAAVAGRSGTTGFRANNANVLAGKLDASAETQVRVMTLPELMDDLKWSSVDLLKVDIEGDEIEMLEACSDQFLSERIAQISIEFHDFCGITPSSIVSKTLKRLRSLGFENIRMSRIGHQDTWLINANLLPVTKFDLLYHRLVTRNWFGLKRVAARYMQAL